MTAKRFVVVDAVRGRFEALLADAMAAAVPGDPLREETFGPVAAVIPVADEEEALRVADGSRFGLGAAVFTRDGSGAPASPRPGSRRASAS